MNTLIFFIILSDGLLFKENEIVFTKGDHLPQLGVKKIREMAQTKDTAITKLTISILYDLGSIKKTSYIIAGNYLHLLLRGNITVSFDESKVKFAYSIEKASLEEQQEPEGD